MKKIFHKFIPVAAFGWFLIFASLYIYFQRSSVPDLIILLLLSLCIGVLASILWLGLRQGLSLTQTKWRVSLAQMLFFGSAASWFVICLLLYYSHDLPLWPLDPYLSAAAHIMHIVSVFVALTVICAVLGRAALSPWFKEPLHGSIESFLRCFSIGLLVMAVFFYLAALLGALNLLSIVLFVCMGLAGFVRYRTEVLRVFYSRAFALGVTQSNSIQGLFYTAFRIMVAVYVVFIVLNVPGYFPLNGDDLHTYYNIPRTFVQYGRIIDFPYDASNNGALAFAYIYAPLLMLGENLLNYVSLLFFVLSCIATFVLGSKMYDTLTGVQASFFFFSMPLAFWFMLSAKTDYLLTFIMCVACIHFIGWMRSEGDRYLALASVLVGFGAAIKYTALLLFPALLIAFTVWAFSERKKLAFIIRACLVSSLFVCVGFAPWALRSAVVYGNPVYPYGWFGSYDSSNVEMVDAEQRVRAFFSTAFDVGHVFNENRSPWWNLFVLVIGKSRYLANRIGPAFFGLLPLVVGLFSLSRRRSELIWSLVLISSVILLWLFTVTHQIWYVLYVFPLWSVVIARSIATIQTSWFFPMIVVVLSVTAGMHLNYSRASLLPFYANAMTREQYMSIFGFGLELNDFLNTEVRPSNPDYLVFPMGQQRQILLEDNHRHLYGDNAFLRVWAPLALSDMTDAEIRDWFRSKRITHAYMVHDDIRIWRRIWCENSDSIAESCPQFESVMRRFDDVASAWPVIRSTNDWIVYQVQ